MMSYSGHYYYNARWYDPQIGRFTTEDPIRDGLNWYAYANNNPLKFVDPTGLEWKLSTDWQEQRPANRNWWERTGGKHYGYDAIWVEKGKNETKGQDLRFYKSGKVSDVGENSAYGKFVVTEHVDENGNTYHTRYAHLSEVTSEVGNEAKTGETMGKAGSTGTGSGPHLHTDTWYDSEEAAKAAGYTDILHDTVDTDHYYVKPEFSVDDYNTMTEAETNPVDKPAQPVIDTDD